MTVSRRDLLRGSSLLAVGLLAGCITAGDPGSGDGSATPTPSPTPTPTPTPGSPGPDDDPSGAGGTRPSGTGGPGISLVAVDDAPALPVRPAVEVTRDTATAEHPPQVRVTVTNTSEDPVRVGEGRAVVFQFVHDDSGDLLFLPAGREYPAAADCWRLTDGIAVTEEYRIVDLAPGESHEAPVDLYGAAGGEGCLPVGEYRFETTYTVLGDDGAGEQQAAWGFSLLLE